MTAFITPGTALTTRITFNSGTLSFGSSLAVQIDNVALNLEYTLSPLFTLNSIKPQAYNRSTQKISMTGKIKSFAPELYQAAMGSSTPGVPNGINTLDGQATFQNPVATFYDANGKEYQYQFTNALFKSYKMTAKMEDYAEWDFELEASDMSIVNTA